MTSRDYDPDDGTALFNLAALLMAMVRVESHEDRRSSPDLRAIHCYAVRLRVAERTLAVRITVKQTKLPQNTMRGSSHLVYELNATRE